MTFVNFETKRTVPNREVSVLWGAHKERFDCIWFTNSTAVMFVLFPQRHVMHFFGRAKISHGSNCLRRCWFFFRTHFNAKNMLIWHDMTCPICMMDRWARSWLNPRVPFESTKLETTPMFISNFDRAQENLTVQCISLRANRTPKKILCYGVF